MTLPTRKTQLAKLEEQINAPDFWSNPKRARRSCRIASAWKSRSPRTRKIAGLTSDLDTLFELAREGENVNGDIEREIRSLSGASGSARNADAAVGRERRAQRHRHHPSRRGRHRKPGLGRDAAAHVPALGGAARLRNRGHGPAGRRRRGHQIRHLRSQRRERLRAAAKRSRRAPAGAHFALRRQRAPAHFVRFGVRLSADRRRNQDRYQARRSARRHIPRLAAPAASTSTAPIRRSA